MKRENDLILRLLLRLEGETDIDLNSYSEDQINYHNSLLIDMGLADGLSVQDGSGERIVKSDHLTIRGHDYLDKHRDELKLTKKKNEDGLASSYITQPIDVSQAKYDAFICHASEDKEEIVRSLAIELIQKGLKIWYDEFSITIGDSLRKSIEKGLAQSRYGIVIISKHFLNKRWPQEELNGLAAKEVNGEKVILPVWHNIQRDEICKESPMLADRLAVETSKGLNEVINKIMEAMHLKNNFEQVDIPILKNKTALSGDDITQWENYVLSRYNYLIEKKINNHDKDPSKFGYWQASFIIDGMKQDSLKDFLEILRKCSTRHTGFGMWCLPIEPYSFERGIELLYLDEASSDPDYSIYWRAELSGRYSLFRGYHEDKGNYQDSLPGKKLDYGIVCYRIAQVFLYIENVCRIIESKDNRVHVRITWYGLENRELSYLSPSRPTPNGKICHQQNVSSQLIIEDTSLIRKTLIKYIKQLIDPLMEAFMFFEISEEGIASTIKDIFDPEKEKID